MKSSPGPQNVKYNFLILSLKFYQMINVVENEIIWMMTILWFNCTVKNITHILKIFSLSFIWFSGSN